MGPTIIFAKQLKESETLNMSQISIHQHFYDENDKYELDENGERIDKFVDKFVAGKVYGARCILTNVSSINQNIEILSQIPTGSIAVNNGFKTRTFFMTLRPYTTNQFLYYFYFPSIGRFQQFPITVSKKGKILGQSKKNKLLIVDEPDIKKKVNVDSWKDVSLKGDEEQIIDYLSKNNVFEIDLNRIYWKLQHQKDSKFLLTLCNVLEGPLKYDPQIWAYTAFKTKK